MRQLVRNMQFGEWSSDCKARERVLHLCSREGMAAAEHKFDESWTYKELRLRSHCHFLHSNTFACSDFVYAFLIFWGRA